MDLARSALLRANDLGAGWTGRASSADETAAPDCPWQDYSRFTITGRAQAQFSLQGASVLSRVELYRSHHEVLGDFAVDDRPDTPACEGAAIRKQVAQASTGVKVSLVSATRLPGPKLGQKSVAFRIVLALRGPGRDLKIYVDLIGFVRDRAAASVVVVAPGVPPRGNVLLARLIDARLQRIA